MAARKPKTASPQPQPVVTPLDVTHTLATAKPSTCGAAFATLADRFGAEVATTYAADGCRRLPRHEVTAEKGHKAEKPMGLLTPKQREARKAAKAAAKAASKPVAAKPPKAQRVKVAGVWYLVGQKRDGSLLLTAEPPVVADVAEAPVTKLVEPKAPKARTAKPKVTTLPMADSPRQVAATPKRAKTTRGKADPTARAAIANA